MSGKWERYPISKTSLSQNGRTCELLVRIDRPSVVEPLQMRSPFFTDSRSRKTVVIDSDDKVETYV
jgi:hypothetical protein